MTRVPYLELSVIYILKSVSVWNICFTYIHQCYLVRCKMHHKTCILCRTFLIIWKITAHFAFEDLFVNKKLPHWYAFRQFMKLFVILVWQLEVILASSKHYLKKKKSHCHLTKLKVIPLFFCYSLFLICSVNICHV